MSHLAPRKLHSLANLAGGADKLPYFDSSDGMVQADLTSAGRALLDDANAGAQRTTLGLAALAIKSTVATADIDNDAVTYAKMQNVSADKVLGSTAGGDPEEIACTAFGRSLIDDAAAVNGRATLGLVIGTDVQAQDAELQAIAGLTSAANKVPRFTGAGTAELIDVTAAGAALLDDASASAQRDTLGLGTGNSPTFTGLTLSGNLTVGGVTTTVDSENVILRANYQLLNQDYTSDAAQAGGLSVVYDPSTTTSGVAGGGFVDAANDTVEVASTAGFAAGDIIMVTGAGDNDGIYEVNALLSTPARLEIKAAPAASVSGIVKTAFAVFGASAGNVYKVAISVLRTGTDGLWEQGKGSDSAAIVFTDLQAAVAYGTAGDLLNVSKSAENAGASASVARADHKHDIDTASAVTVDAGTANGEGVSANLARADHSHAIPSAAPAASGSLAAASALGSSPSLARADHVHSTAPSAHGVDFGTSGARWDYFGRTLDVDGSHVVKQATFTGATPVVGVDDYIMLCDPTTQAQTVNLPAAASSAGRMLKIKHSSGSANVVTIDGNAAESIDGAPTQALSSRSSITLICDGSNWHIL